MKIWAIALASLGLLAQEAPQQAKPKISSLIGEVKSKEAAKLTVRTDAGETYTVNLDEKTSFVRVQPGEKDLSKGTKIAQTDVNVGDRVLARGQVDEEQKTIPARMVVVMTKTDLEQKQARERAEWQSRGASGVATAVTPDAVTITQKVRGESKNVVLAISPNTKVRRYANDSVRFNDAKQSSAAEIKVGDHVRALGNKNEDGSKIAAEEIVFGTFRLIPATVISADAATGELKVTDLDSKKPIIVLATPDSLVKRLPQQMAMMLAMQVNGSAVNAAMGGIAAGRQGGAPGAPGSQGQRPQGDRPQGGQGAPGGAGSPAAAGGQRAPGVQAGQPGQGGAGFPGGGGQRGPGGFSGAGGGMRGGDLASVIERLPAIPLSELKPGDALIINSTAAAGSMRVSAITILAGVEPILTSAPRSAGQINLGSWSLGGDAAGMAQ